MWNCGFRLKVLIVGLLNHSYHGMCVFYWFINQWTLMWEVKLCVSAIIIIIIIGIMISNSSRIDEPWGEMWGCVCLPYRQTSACSLRGDSTEAAPVELHWSKFHIHRYNMSRILCVWSPKQKLRCYGQWPRLSAHNHLSPAAPSLWLGGDLLDQNDPEKNLVLQ